MTFKIQFPLFIIHNLTQDICKIFSLY